jgi:acyl-CoA thioesterase-1
MVLAACSGEQATPRSATPESSVISGTATPGGTIPAGRGPRVVVLGTSLTAGLGLDPDSAWPALVQRLADSAGVTVRIEAAGLSGETSAGALRRAEWVLRSAADLVVLEVGANDGLRGVDPDTTRETLVALVRRVQAVQPAARIALVQMEAPPNLGASYTQAFREAYVVAAERTGVPLLPFLLEGVAGEASLNQADGIHPNEAGSHVVAATMWRALAPLVAELGGR